MSAFRLTTRAALIAALWLMLVVALAKVTYTSNLLVSLQHIDGAYQTLSMLRRLSVGELPGRDFFPYLGMGIGFVLLPLYSLAGSTLFASQFAAALASALVCLAGGTLLSALTLRSFGLRRVGLFAIAGGAALLALALAEDSSRSVVHAGVSLYSLRSALVYAAAGVFYLAARDGRWSVWISGIASAVFLTWSNDFALTATLVLHAMLLLHCSLALGWWAASRACLVSLGIALVGYAALGMLLTGGHLGAVLRYNWLAVAADQYWYFGPYTRIYHYNSVSELLLFWRRLDPAATLQLVATLGFSVPLLWSNLRGNRAAMAVGVATSTALLAGVLSEFGGHKDLRYYQMTFHLLPLLPLLTLSLLVARAEVDARSQALIDTVRVPLRRALEASIVIAVVFGCGFAVSKAVQQKTSVTTNARLVFVPQLGGYLSHATATELAVVRTKFGAGPVVALSTYMNPYDLVLGHQQAAPVDSIIHALGFLRPAFADALADPRVQRVVTSNLRSPNGDDRLLENWSLHQNWWFYRRLHQHFDAAFVGQRLILWTRRAARAPARTAVPCRVDAQTPRTLLGVDQLHIDGLYDLEVAYQLRCDNAFTQARARVVAHATSRNGHLGGDYGLPPHAQRARLPLIPTPAGSHVVLRAEPFPECRLQVHDCRAARLE